MNPSRASSRVSFRPNVPGEPPRIANLVKPNSRIQSYFQHRLRVTSMASNADFPGL